jgi:hypothetical protein
MHQAALSHRSNSHRRITLLTLNELPVTLTQNADDCPTPSVTVILQNPAPIAVTAHVSVPALKLPVPIVATLVQFPV